MSKKLILTLITGVNKGERIELTSGRWIFGRGEGNGSDQKFIDLQAYDPDVKISREHASIVVGASGVAIEDLGSLNGTILNRDTQLALGTSYRLSTGDELIFGKTCFRVVIEEI